MVLLWHANYQTEEGSMCHPSDAKAWRHFDQTHPNFTAEPRNVRLGLCTDGFAPHGHYDRTYSCWSIIFTPYNLPSRMCMSSEYMFLMMVIPGPSNLKRLINVYLEPLIEELKNLWHVGVLTRDSTMDEILKMRAALMWTVNDLPAYGMAFGWSSAGVMGCPVCIEDTRAFYLHNSRKACYFDCYRQFLPLKKAFTKNRVERKGARLRLTGEQIRDWAEEFSPAVEASLSLPDGYGQA
ncbi:UNVERIFIED_CONTAM: hypothetical protein Sradi_3625900 [Sesamum radiatum]|uniref:Uncharacterized protein n=1 Tax=Sesamum radiatum TaxID=300843 RepID=A0AAW2QJC5_SESRA